MCKINKLSCVVCGNDSIKFAYSLFSYNYYTCTKCDLTKIYPVIPEEDLINKHYNYDANIANGNSINELNLFILNPSRIINRIKKTRFKPISKVRELKELFENKNSNIIDLGCGSGVFICSLYRLGYKNIYGTEIQLDPVKHILKHFPIAVRHGPIMCHNDFPLFEIVTCFDVLEHIPDPALAVQQIVRMLKPNGYVHIRVPNYGSLTSKLFGRRWLWNIPPFHLNYFNKRSLKYLFESNNLKVVNLYTSPSGYRFVYTLLQLQKLYNNNNSIDSPNSRKLSNMQYFLIDSFELLYKIVILPIILVKTILDIDECITLIAQKPDDNVRYLSNI